jgi:hypothetical protein
MIRYGEKRIPTHQQATTVCSAVAKNVIPMPIEPKFPPNTFSIAMQSRPNGAAVVGLANSSLTTGNAIIIFPKRRLLNMNDIVLHM